MTNLCKDKVQKLPATRKVFSSDPNGFNGGLLMIEGQVWRSQRKILSKILHLETLHHYVAPMDDSAALFVEVLSRDREFIGTDQVMQKCSKMTFEVICKCLMGDLEHDCQSKPNQPIFRAITDLGTMLEWRLANILLIRLMKLLPFGDYYLKNNYPVMSDGMKGIGS